MWRRTLFSRLKYLLVITLLFSPLGALAGPLDGPDKPKHLIASAGIVGLSYGVMRAYEVEPEVALPVAVGLSLAAGFAKESMDPHFDPDDIGANLLGVTFAVIVINF
jgi:hypothetical protein